ncbi:MAG: hypothetical protein ACI4WS_10670 [Oscillospiraceae bacterium]
MSRAMRYLLSAAFLCAAAGILLNPAALSAAVRNSVAACLEVVIPSLFAFTVLAVYMQQSGLYRMALRPLTFPLSKLLRIPEELCAVFLLANIGGYPVGARLLRALVRSGRISRRDSGRMLCCCYGSGPSFVIGTAGMVVFGSAAVGGILFGACFLSSLIIAAIVCRSGEPIVLQDREEKAGFDLSADCFVRSADSGARVMYTVCVMATLFSAITALLDAAGITGVMSRLLKLAGAGGNSGGIIPALLEVTRIRELRPTCAALPLCAALLSFGGVCVLMQITAVSGGDIPVKPLVLSRIPAAALSAALATPASLMIPYAVEVSSANTALTVPFSVNSGMSVCVLIMAGILIYSVEKEGGKL